MISTEVLPMLVAIAILSRKFPYTALGGSLIIAGFHPMISIIGALIVGIGVRKWLIQTRINEIRNEIANEFIRKMESQMKESKDETK